MGCKDAVLPEPLLKKQTVNCLTFEKTQDNHVTTNYVFFMLLLSIFTAINDWKEKHKKFSIRS